MDFRLPMPQLTLSPVADAEEELRRALAAGVRPAAASASVLPRTRKTSAGGAVTSAVKPEEDTLNSRAMLSKALQMYSSAPDTSELNELARQRALDGNLSMLNALTAQVAGERFLPVQSTYLKRSMAAQEPMKVGNYGTISGGKYVADPYASRDTEADALMRVGGQIMADDRADRREANMFARQQAQLLSAERRANAREDALLAKQAAKDAEQAKKDAVRTQSRMSTADTVINNVSDAKDLLSKTWGGGFTRARTSQVPGTDAFTLAKRIDTIKANLGFDALAAMREASPTGGALGQVAVQEINYLQSTIANLDVGLPDDELAKSLEAVDRHYQNIKMLQEGIMPPEYRNGAGGQAAGGSRRVVVDY